MSSFLGFIFSQKWYKYWGICSRLETKLTLNSWKSCDIWFSWHRSSVSCFWAPFVHSRKELMTGTESNKARTASLLQCKCLLNRGTGSGVDVTCCQMRAVAPTGTSHPLYSHVSVHIMVTLPWKCFTFLSYHLRITYPSIFQCYAFRALRFLFSMERNRPLFKRYELREIWVTRDHGFNCFHRPALYANSKRRKSLNANHVSSDFLRCTDTAKQC